MEIKIDEKQVQNVLNEQAEAGIKNAFSGYAVKSILEKAIADSVIPGIIVEAMEKSASSLDIDNLSKILAAEIARSVTRGVQLVIRETMINIILDIQKIPSYEDEKRVKARAIIENKLDNQ